jgi:hypothetical protein
MKTTTTLVLGLMGLLAVACGGNAQQGTDPGETIQCGSAELFSTTHDACGAMDAVGVAGEDGITCRCHLGFKWNGTACDAIGGCACAGEDCGKLTETLEECEQNHTACDGSDFQCGSPRLFSSNHASCESMDAKGAGPGCRCVLGYAWNGTACEMLSNCECEGADCDKLTQSQEECEQAHTSCGSTTPRQCGSMELYAAKHDVCGAMDATAVSDETGLGCYCFLGFAWNGTACESLANCACDGADCDKLTQTEEQCEQAHAGCAETSSTFACGSAKLYAAKHDACDAMDAKAVPDDTGSSCFCFLGFAWNGTACEGLSDCACQGADCDKLAETVEQCEQTHAACL